MKPAVHFPLTMLAVAILSASSHVFAEDTADSTMLENIIVDQLSTLEVKGQTYRNTATKTQLDPEETPQAISIIDAESLESLGVESVSEAVRYSAGVNTELRGGAISRLDLFNIRGFDNDTVLLDGLPLLYNDWNLQPQIDMSTVEQIEIFKGPTSTLYGEMPPGGMVNIISKVPQDEEKTSLEVVVGSDSKKEVSLDTTGAISDSARYRLITKISESDGQAVTSENKRMLIAPSLDLDLSADTQLNLNMYYQNDPSMGVYSSLPSRGTVYSNINGQLSDSAYAGDANWETYDRDVLLLGYKLDHSINQTWSFMQNARVTIAEAYQENTYSTGLDSDERTLNRRAYLTDESTKGINLDNQLSAIFDIGEAEHNVLFGVDYLTLTSDIKYEDAVAPSIDLYDPNYYQIIASDLDFAASGYSSDFTIKKKQTGLYIQDQVRLNNWVLLAGGRYDRFSYEETGTKYGADATTKIDQNQFSGRVGALYEFDNGISPFINFAQSFEPVSGSDKDGNDFDTSTANQWETGLKYQSRGLTTSATVFEIIKSNVLTNDPNGTAYDKIQVGEVRARGLELEAKQALTPRGSVSVAYTLQDVEVTKDNSGIAGNTPIWTPEQQFSAWLNYAPDSGALAGASFGTGLRYVGSMQVDAENSDTVPSYTLVDLSVGYDLAQLSANWKGASVKLAVTNAFDETYYSCYDTDNCWYGADRSFEISGRYDF
ncbi:TonB-dependent siderophore receptor [Marinomonas sp. A79]|uniref:TonB-dependent siderophore receptor n=1 Tax=Marinomonas vulgaris TaxID=2823372 RepID=A0ABS5H9K7_9GAMM|nr:TonB-dependent siderophore receptor [Marinomonas vulgaris]MBR7888127.1 TonB-dependent siderophore receptor [Marinomonas vulgaris]